MSKDRAEHVPDTSETYERGHPSKEPGLGKVDDPDHPKGNTAGDAGSSVNNDVENDEINADDTQNQADVVQPESDTAHGNRNDPGEA